MSKENEATPVVDPANNGGTVPTPAPAPAVAGLPVPSAPAENHPGFVPVATVEKARQEEKQKLYPQIAEKDETIKQLRAEITRIEGVLATIEKAKNGSKEIDVAKLVDEVSTKVGKEAQSAFESRINSMQTQIETLTKERDRLHLEKVRSQAIKDIGEENLIPDLVTGDSEEAIIASARKSQEIFTTARNRVVNGGSPAPSIPNPDTTKRAGSPPPSLPPSNPGAGRGNMSGEEAKLAAVKTMTAREYGALSESERAELRNAAAKRYRPSN